MAGDCPMNCCTMLRVPFFEWERRMFDTKPEWQDVDGRQRNIREFTHEESGWRMCNTDERNVCVFCTDDRLCGLQLRYGESAMPSVCRTYPRIITKFPGRVEYSLDPCCPAVVYSLKDWKIGEVLIEGDAGCDLATDSEYESRKKAMECLADSRKTLAECFSTCAEIYGLETKVPFPVLPATKNEFLRKVFAYSLWTYALAYYGFPGVGSICGLLLKFFAGYVPTLQDCSDDWDVMSRHFAAALISYCKEIGFDLEIEDRYCDSSDSV